MKLRIFSFSWQVFVGVLLLSGSSCLFMYTCLLSNNILMEWEFGTLFSVKFLFQLFIDKQALIFVSTVSLICSSVMFFTSNYMNGDSRIDYISLIILMFVGSMVYLILSPNLVMLMLGWDGLGLTSYLLVIYYNNHKSISAGMITIMTNRIGDVMLMLGCVFAFSSSFFNFSFSNYSSFMLMSLVLIIGAMTKSAQFPFSAWLPAAMAAPTPVSALVHSSTLVTAGVYLMIRFYPSMAQYNYLNDLLLVAGVSTCLLAGLSAIYEMDFKKMVALSTMSQLGVMTLSLGLGQPNIAYFHLISHALMKALLFICAGSVIHSMSDNQDIRLMGGLSVSMPLTSSVMNVSNMALCGFPFLSGFYSKDAIVEIFFSGSFSFIIGVLLMGSVVFTSAYMMRLSVISLWSPFKGSPLKSVSDESSVIKISYVVLMLGTLFAVPAVLWVIKPVVLPMVLPSVMKISTLILVLSMGFTGVLVTMSNYFGPLPSLLSSLWYLNYVSSSPFSEKAFTTNSYVSYNEYSWMEYPVWSFLSKTSIQSLFNINMMASMSVVFVLALMLYSF